MIVTGKASLDRMVADGELGIEDAHHVARFAAFLRNVGPATCTCEKGQWSIETRQPIAHCHVDQDTLRYVLGDDVDPPGTDDNW